MKKDHKVTDYIQYQKGIVDDKLCWRLTNKQFEFKPSGYATHDSGKVVKTDRVLMDDAWIKSNDELMKMINEIKESNIIDGGSGAFYIFLKKNLQNKF